VAEQPLGVDDDEGAPDDDEGVVNCEVQRNFAEEEKEEVCDDWDQADSWVHRMLEPRLAVAGKLVAHETAVPSRKDESEGSALQCQCGLRPAIESEVVHTSMLASYLTVRQSVCNRLLSCVSVKEHVKIENVLIRKIRKRSSEMKR
jgi:hypothetical protein